MRALDAVTAYRIMSTLQLKSRETHTEIRPDIMAQKKDPYIDSTGTNRNYHLRRSRESQVRMSLV